MSNKSLEIEARFGALEYMLQRLYMVTYATNGATSEVIAESHENMRSMIRNEKFGARDAGQEALAQGLFEDAFQHFLSGLESMLVEQGMLRK